MDDSINDNIITSDEGAFSDEQMHIIFAFERVGASLSVIGVISIFLAFALFKRLRTVPNTFIVFASIANVGASIACLMGNPGMTAEESHLCQAQAFLFELYVTHILDIINILHLRYAFAY